MDIANIRLGLIVPRGIPYAREPVAQTVVAPEENVADEVTESVKHDVNVTSMPAHGILIAIFAGIKIRHKQPITPLSEFIRTSPGVIDGRHSRHGRPTHATGG
ncbi:hypothetical protein EMIT0215P_80238 [Pseudomonas serboccidentalis]